MALKNFDFNQIKMRFARSLRTKRQKIFYEKMCSVRIKYAPLLEELKSIPHLPLDLNFNVNRAWAEVQQVKDWAPNILDMKEISDEFRELHKTKFVGRVIRGISKNSNFMTDDDENGWDHPSSRFNSQGQLRLFRTDFAEQVPYCYKWLNEIQFPSSVTRLMRLSPDHGLFWHSHHLGPIYHPVYNHGFAITVIKTNDNVINGVRLKEQTETAIYKRYESGTTHLLNGWHDHQVINNGKNDRYCLQHLMNLNDEKTLVFLQKYIEKYNGPRLVVSN